MTTSPDPDAPARSVQDEAAAGTTAARLTAAGFPAKAQQVRQPAVADLPASVLDARVRLDETFASKVDADAVVARIKAAPGTRAGTVATPPPGRGRSAS